MESVHRRIFATPELKLYHTLHTLIDWRILNLSHQDITEDVANLSSAVERVIRDNFDMVVRHEI